MTSRVLWVSTADPGGIGTVLRTLSASPLTEAWAVERLATHRSGSTISRIVTFATGTARFVLALLRDRPVVHLHAADRGSFVRKALLLWLARLLGAPVLLHVHTGHFVGYYESCPRPVRAFVRATLTAADRVVALSPRWRDRIAEIAPRARIIDVPNGIVVPDRPPRRRGGPPHVVYLGKLDERKGVFVLLPAWARALHGLPDGAARLTLAGDGDRDRVDAELDRLGIRDSVRVCDWLGPDEVRELLGSADVLTLPSLAEGQPMSVLEAMACGLCVVASDVGGIPDLLDGGAAGRLVRPGDADDLAGALHDVLTDAVARQRLAAAARERAVEHHDVRHTWTRVDALYRELSAERAGDLTAGRAGP